jgi:hypothetical protein
VIQNAGMSAAARSMSASGESAVTPSKNLPTSNAHARQLFGLLGFELTNQTRGLVEDHAALFEAATRSMGAALGLR